MLKQTVLALATFLGKDHQIPSVLDILLQIFDLSLGQFFSRGSHDKQTGPFESFKLDRFLGKSNLIVTLLYLVGLFELLRKFLQIGARVACLVLARVEYYLQSLCCTVF